ncbi:hypothetical protein Taro_049404 [Colocasia esculenta]|uniref:Uncharacterized protein n=1 Tax=Colocasia esculenta TaxID=4460 RepID=A0A843XAU3_COLES|nr:hypothetical protein [Colocasia esculenta]
MPGTSRDPGPGSLDQTYNSNTGVRASKSDDTDLDGTTQVPGQSPELTAWLTENLGHPTGELKNLASIDVDAKIFGHQLHRNPGLIPQYSAATPPPLAYHDLAEIVVNLPILFLYL